MIKKIKVKELTPGMFIHDLNCRWFEHPFFTSQMKVTDRTIVQKLNEHGIKDVFIDTSKGSDLLRVPEENLITADGNAELEECAEIKSKDRSLVTVRGELVKADLVKKSALTTVESVLAGAKLGKGPEIEAVESVVYEMIHSVERNKDALISIGRIKKVHEYTSMHSVSVGILMVAFGMHLGFDLAQVRQLGIGGLLHDIGKATVPEALIKKPGYLSEEERKTIQAHVDYGRKILENSPHLGEISFAVTDHHHERLDGTGYPNHIRGDDISIFGQMSAIVDVYDAMTSDRSYKKRRHPTEVLRMLHESENIYKRELVERFISCIGIYPAGTLVRLESGYMGVVLGQGERSLLHPRVRVMYNLKKQCVTTPRTVDLSRPSKKWGDDRVVGYESPDKWQITPHVYL